MFFLAKYHNMTIHEHRLEDMPERRGFLLDISPRSGEGSAGTADARWIDMTTGLYLNVTAMRYKVDRGQEEGLLYSKVGDKYLVCLSP